MNREKNRRKKENKKKRKNQKINNNNNINSEENVSNAAPILDPFKEDEKNENYGPPEDYSMTSYNNFADKYNKLKKITLNFNNNTEFELEESKSLKYMKKVNEEDLELNWIHENCFIIIEIVSRPLSLVSLQFIGNDENNNRMLISVYNYHNKFTINDFKQGTYMIIKEPYYKRYLDLDIGIRVDNPNNIILFKDKDEVNNYIKKEKE